MTKLTLLETPNVTITRAFNQNVSNNHTRLQLNHFQVSSMPDGNCSVNSFALALIQLIQDNQEEHLQFDFNNFLVYLRKEENLRILHNRIQSYDGNYYDLEPYLQNFIIFISNPALTETDFYNYIKASKSRLEIAALQLALAPALREAAVNCHIARMRNNGNFDALGDDEDLFSDRSHAGEILEPLAYDFFNLNLNIILQTVSANDINYRLIQPSQPIAGAATVTLLQTPGHWDCLIPSNSSMVPALHASQNVSSNRHFDEKQKKLLVFPNNYL